MYTLTGIADTANKLGIVSDKEGFLELLKRYKKESAKEGAYAPFYTVESALSGILPQSLEVKKASRVIATTYLACRILREINPKLSVPMEEKLDYDGLDAYFGYVNNPKQYFKVEQKLGKKNTIELALSFPSLKKIDKITKEPFYKKMIRLNKILLIWPLFAIEEFFTHTTRDLIKAYNA